MGLLRKLGQVFAVVSVAALASIPFKRVPPPEPAARPTSPTEVDDEELQGQQPPLQLQHTAIDQPPSASDRPLPAADSTTGGDKPIDPAPLLATRPLQKIPADAPRAERVSSGAAPPSLDSNYQGVLGDKSRPSKKAGGRPATIRAGAGAAPVKPIVDRDRVAPPGEEATVPVSIGPSPGSPTGAGDASTAPSSNSPSPSASPQASNSSDGTNGGNADRRHMTVPGDTLELLAERYLGDRQKANEIAAANRSVVSTDAPLAPGVELRIP